MFPAFMCAVPIASHNWAYYIYGISLAVAIDDALCAGEHCHGSCRVGIRNVQHWNDKERLLSHR